MAVVTISRVTSILARMPARRQLADDFGNEFLPLINARIVAICILRALPLRLAPRWSLAGPPESLLEPRG